MQWVSNVGGVLVGFMMFGVFSNYDDYTYFVLFKIEFKFSIYSYYLLYANTGIYQKSHNFI